MLMYKKQKDKKIRINIKNTIKDFFWMISQITNTYCLFTCCANERYFNKQTREKLYKVNMYSSIFIDLWGCGFVRKKKKITFAFIWFMHECQEIIFKRKTFYLKPYTWLVDVCFLMYKNKQHIFVTPTGAIKSWSSFTFHDICFEFFSFWYSWLRCIVSIVLIYRRKI